MSSNGDWIDRLATGEWRWLETKLPPDQQRPGAWKFYMSALFHHYMYLDSVNGGHVQIFWTTVLLTKGQVSLFLK